MKAAAGRSGLIFPTLYVSFQLILLNHATYEVARIGGMTTTSPPGHGCGKHKLPGGETC